MMKQARKAIYCLAASAGIIAFIVYLPVLRNEFIEWDDGGYVFQNPYIRSLDMAFLKWAFLNFHASNWHPLTWISHALDYALWGLNPLGHHLTSIVLHGLNTFLVVLLIARLIEAWKDRAEKSRQTAFPSGPSMLIAAGTTGFLFGLHPVHVESVAWVAERKDLLCALFYLSSMLTYANYAAGTAGAAAPRSPFARLADKRYLGTLGFFILALLSKPMAVTLPVVLLVLDWRPFRRIPSWKALRTVVAEKIPFLTLSVFSSILTIMAQSSTGSLSSIQNVPGPARALVAIQSLALYLWKMIWPFNLVPFYPYPTDASLLSGQYLFASACVIGITVACIVAKKKQEVWISAWSYYVITLIPVLGIVQVGGQAMADRYTYLPSLGPFLIIGLAVARIWESVQNLEKRRLFLKLLSGITAAFVFASLIFLTIDQTDLWKNTITLWSDVIVKEPNKVPVAYTNRGIAFAKKGLVDEALKDFNKAILLDPSDPLAYANLGNLYINIGQFEKAFTCLDRAIALSPAYPEPYNNRGIINVYTGRYERALEDFNKAITVQQDYAAAYYNRGSLFLRTGKRELAVADFQRACDLGSEKGCKALYSST